MNFIKLRLATLAWGFIVSYIFTGELVTSLYMFAVMGIGNTIIMYLLTK